MVQPTDDECGGLWGPNTSMLYSGARGGYPGSYRVMWEEDFGGPKARYTYVNGVDELDAYRRFQRWLALPYPEERGNVAPYPIT